MIIVRWLLRQWDKVAISPGLIRSGKWRVKYSDGYSRLMTYDICKDYAEMFNGEVVWCRYTDPYEEEQDE